MPSDTASSNQNSRAATVSRASRLPDPVGYQHRGRCSSAPGGLLWIGAMFRLKFPCRVSYVT
jgi:hypothetical protein